MLRYFFLLFFLCQPIFLQAADRDFLFQVKKLSDQATHKREGVVIWSDLAHSKQDVFGNINWLDNQFLPGSIFKLILAQTLLESGTQFQYQCTGKDKLAGKVMHCWTYRGHGSLDLPQALALSCNLYFQNLGLKLGLSKILETMKQYPSLPAVRGETLPQGISSEFKLTRFFIGDDPSYRLTPRQLSEFWNQYVLKIQEDRYQAIFQGLRRSVQRGGTASKLKNSPLEILAKTGTGDSLNPNYKTNAWFLGAYPAKNPQYTLLILLQEAHGFEEATALAEKIFSKL